MSDQSGPRRGFQVSTSARIIRLTSDSWGVLATPEVVLSSTYGTFTSRTRGVGLVVAPNGLSHDRNRLRDPGGDRPGRHSQHVGDLLARQSLVVMKDDGRAKLGAELSHRLLDHVPRLGAVVVAAVGGHVEAGGAAGRPPPGRRG